MSLAFCLCWKKKRSASDLTGTGGTVIIKHSDENVNHLTTDDSLSAKETNTDNESKKRGTPPSSTRRSLPDIPLEHGNIKWEPTIDNSSEHYATVEHYRNSKKPHPMSNVRETSPSISQQSSLSQPEFTPYERVKYHKIESKEHPYAQLKPQPTDRTSNNNILLEPGTSQRISFEENQVAENENHVDISAASAVAGGVAANAELPYMTPPQSNFSGDSQDSSKGYTSISVREPLSSILAQTTVVKERDNDQHYSTVSDDSDDVYTTIPDPNQIHSREDEATARVSSRPIVITAEINNGAPRPYPTDTSNEMYDPVPQPSPPSVDSLKSVTQTTAHSKQTSPPNSTVNISSPKPEKRQTNSPLPPPPFKDDPDVERIALAKNIDDLYAKVRKNKHISPNGSRTFEKQSNILCSKSSSSKEDTNSRENMSEINCGNHNYETLNMRNEVEDPYKIYNEPGYAKIKGSDSICDSDSGYEVLKDNTQLEPNYEKLSPNYSNSTEAGYSNIDDGNYSEVKKYKKQSSSFDKTKHKPSENPDYESIINDHSDKNRYASIRSRKSETYVNYESLNNSCDSPNYESIKHSVDESSTNQTKNESAQNFEYCNNMPVNETVMKTSEDSDGIEDSCVTKNNQYIKQSSEVEKTESFNNHNSKPAYLTKENINAVDNSRINASDIFDENIIFDV